MSSRYTRACSHRRPTEASPNKRSGDSSSWMPRASLQDLAIPGNRLEKLSGDRRGWHSIRINDQWRICFHWQDGDAHDVEIVDYH